jgi:nitrous oxidase accessory protein NosD
MLDDAAVRGSGLARPAIVLMSVLALARPAHPMTIVVGPSDGTCPGVIFGRIQSAIDAAVPGTTIFVCAGSYPEQLLVTKRVHLVAAAGVRLVPPPLAVLTTSPSSGRGVAAAVTLRAPGTIDGFAIDVRNHGITTCDGTEPLLAGVYARNVAASVLGTAVTGTRIDGATAACTNGVAILVEGGGGAPRVRLEGNSLDAYQQAGILLQGAGMRAVVRENVVEGAGGGVPYAQSGIVVANGAAARIEDNVVRGHAGIEPGCAVDAGIVLAAPRIRVVGNQLEANAVGVRADSRGHLIRDNAVDGGNVGLVGLDLAADESRVTGNVFMHQAVAGIRIAGNRSRLRANTLTGVHEVPRCAALRDDAACAGLSARCGAGVWLLGRANQLATTAISDVDVPVIDDGRLNTIRLEAARRAGS